MLVFLDSSILCSDYYMRGTYFELVKRTTSIILSEVVLDEVKNKHKEMIAESIQSTNKRIVELNRLLSAPLPMVQEEIISKELQEYSDFIEMFLIESGETIAESYPNIEHKDIVERALQRKKPFKADGKNGYRDYLVWRTFLQVAKRYVLETVCFLTLNKNDFSDVKNDKLLHPDLLADIDEMGIDRNRIQYWTSLKDFVEGVIKPMLSESEKHEKFTNDLLSDELGFAVPLEKMLSNKIVGMDLSEYEILVVGENPSLSSFDLISTEIEKFSQISEAEYLLEIHLDTFCSIDSFIFKSELVSMDEEDLGFTIIVDSDWNDHYALAETQIGIKIDLEVIYNMEKKTFLSFEVSDISDYNCLYCPFD